MSEVINQSSGITRSYWVEGSRSLEYSPLSQDLTVDVAVVGGGIAGLSTAYELIKRGRSVALLEDGFLGSGETSRTSGHLSSYVDGPLATLKQLFGLDALRALIDCHIQAIKRIEKVIEEEGIACDFKPVNGYLFGEDGDQNALKVEAKVLGELKSFPFEWIEKAPFHHFDTGACLQLSGQAQFHPLKYLSGLARALVKQGGQIFEGTKVKEAHDGSPCLLITANGFKVSAQAVVVATNAPINSRLALPLKQAQYRTYVIGVAVPTEDLAEGLYWDTASPYHYLRKVASPKEGFDYVLIGGADHKTGLARPPKKAFLELIKWSKERLPHLKVVYEWSGQVIEPMDRMAFIGRSPLKQNIFIQTGASGSGLSYGAISGVIFADLITKKSSPYQDLLSPSRTTLKSSGRFFKNTCHMAAQYGDWLKASPSADGLLPHEGVVQRKGLAQEAVYKDGEGHLHRLSAICPHLGGVVRWNSLEKTWDCPCHGSRFSAEGDVINGPANKGLKKIT